eukprot:Nk52_evm1s498 gene=Nk52_evmTU1s498
MVHRAQKPIQLINDLMAPCLTALSSRHCPVVYDMFSGTGTVAVAAITNGLSVRVFEKHPPFISLISKRLDFPRLCDSNLFIDEQLQEVLPPPDLSDMYIVDEGESDDGVLPDSESNTYEAGGHKFCCYDALVVPFLISLLLTVPNLITIHPTKVPRLSTLPPFRVELKPGAKLRRQRAYTLSKQAEDFAKEAFQKEVEGGMFIPCSSEMCSPLLVVWYPRPRLVYDDRYLNSIINKVFWPLPVVEYLINKAVHAVIFSAIDVSHAFNSIGIHEDSQKLLAIVSPFGRVYVPTARMTLGIATAFGLSHEDRWHAYRKFILPVMK